jgi:hypothetical protein
MERQERHERHAVLSDAEKESVIELVLTYIRSIMTVQIRGVPTILPSYHPIKDWRNELILSVVVVPLLVSMTKHSTCTQQQRYGSIMNQKHAWCLVPCALCLVRGVWCVVCGVWFCIWFGSHECRSVHMSLSMSESGQRWFSIA